MRWYLILGIPGETDEDMDELVALIGDVAQVYRGKLDVTQTILQPAPHTPLQWMSGRAQPAAHARGLRLRDEMRALWERTGAMVTASQPKGEHLHEHDTALQRADRSWHRYLMRATITAMRTERWREIAQASGLDPGPLLDEIDPDTATPWSHVDVGASTGKARMMWDRIRRTIATWQTAQAA